MVGTGAATCPNCSKIKEMARIRLRKGGNKSRISIGSNKSDKSTQRIILPKITQSPERHDKETSEGDDDEVLGKKAKDKKATKSQKVDIDFQLKFWQKVHSDALETKHPKLIKDSEYQLKLVQ